MKFIVKLILSAALTGGVLVAQTKPARQEAAARVAGTRVSLTPPPGFVAAERFAGYGLESEGASVMVTEMPAPLAKVLPSLGDPAALGKQSMTLLGREAVRVGGRSAWLFHYRQTAAGSEFLKWMLVIGDERELVLVTASFPKASARKLSAALRQSVLSARWNAGESVAAEEGLSFRVTVAGGTLKLASRFGNGLVYSAGGVIPVESVDDPFFVVGPSTGGPVTADRKAFSAARVSQVKEVSNVGAAEPGEITIDGLQGYEIVTTGRDRESGRPLVVYQVTLFDDEGYYLMIGLVGARHAPAHLDTFKQMARSFRRAPLKEK